MKYIAQDMVDEFCRLASKITKLTKEKKDLREKILDKLMKGFSLPTNGPEIIELAQNGGMTEIDWESRYVKLYTAACVKKHGVLEGLEKAKEHLDKIRKESVPKTAVTIGGVEYVGGVKLNTRDNENYKESAA